VHTIDYVRVWSLPHEETAAGKMRSEAAAEAEATRDATAVLARESSLKY
jgi:hypothetical protein